MDGLEKVTVFITRKTRSSHELLLFRHPTAGIQIPAGTVEEGELPVEAGRREAQEETGLQALIVKANIGIMTSTLAPSQRIVRSSTPVYSRPDRQSFAWARFRRGIPVTTLREQENFTHVSYEELDNLLRPAYVTYHITGWVPSTTVTRHIDRHFVHFEANEQTPGQWELDADHHVFSLFWASFSQLPEIISPQDTWLPYVQQTLQYTFHDE